MIPPRFKVLPSEAAILLHNVMTCEHADNDADRTVHEIIKEIDQYQSSLPRALFESALYCCNMEDEEGTFWHPKGHAFSRFLLDVIPSDLYFDTYYHLIYEKKKQAKAKT